MSPHFIPSALACAALLTAGLTSCLTIPNGNTLNLSGKYQVVAHTKSGDVNFVAHLTEQNTAVQMTLTNTQTGEIIALSGTRSIQGGSPVQLSVAGDLGSGSQCAGGYTDHYTSSLAFGSSGNGKGTLWHEACDNARQTMYPSAINAGVLELVRQ